MAWRTADTHRTETTTVKRALRTAGFSVHSVKHGRGTAWGWLSITLDESRHDWDDTRRAITVAQDATGRVGEYGGRINVHRR